MTRKRFLKTNHIRSSLDFQRIYDQRVRAGDNHLLIFASRNEFDHPRIGLSVSRKHGPAVVRNRIKRLLREAYRLTQDEIPAGYDFVLIPRQNSGAELSDYRRSLKRLTRKLADKLEKGQS